jgi:hypothetical protein
MSDDDKPADPPPPPPKPKSFYLTLEEIEALRAKAKSNDEYFHKAFAHLRPKKGSD